MMNKLTKIVAASIIALLSFDSYAQMGVTSYSIYSLGINTSQNKAISGELKTFTNRTFENLLLEADIFYNFKPRPYHRFSIGIGFNIGPFRGFDHINALTIPAQLEIYPLQDFKKLSLLFELTPEFIVESDVNLRSLWGVRYTFGKLKE